MVPDKTTMFRRKQISSTFTNEFLYTFAMQVLMVSILMKTRVVMYMLMYEHVIPYSRITTPFVASSPVPIFRALCAGVEKDARASPYAGKRGTGDEATPFGAPSHPNHLPNRKSYDFCL